MTVDEFERALDNFGESVNNLSPILFDLGGRIVDEMKRNAPFDKGNLKSSIKAVIDEESLSFQMLAYGLFQNYGVKPDYNTTTEHKPFNSRFGGIKNPEEVPFGVEPRPTSGNFYTYSNRKFGLPRRQFFDANEIATIIADGVAQQLTTDF